ncbi:MAG: hypothetical protein HWE16_11525 [Gammaproteobacteria bacterium]|nr:hypothetical protein [Gammaproteobacteria bacterium]
MKNIMTTLLLISSLSLIGCPENSGKSSSTEAVKTYQATQEDLAALNKEILMLIEDKSCNVDSDCAAIALGARACGGPESYAVYAPNNTDVSKLQSLAAQLESLNKIYNQNNQVMSICKMELEPSVQCVQNQCQKVTGVHLIQ